MSIYRIIFPRRNTLLIVIHVENTNQAIRNAVIAKEEGADGIFLINHRISAQLLIDCFVQVKQLFPDLWIGLNCLDLSPLETLSVLPHDVDGMWIDNAGIYKGKSDDMRLAQDFEEARDIYKHHCLYFGGVAFKYQNHEKDPAGVAKLAVPFMDVVTTSGEGTGIAADIRKILLMKEAIGNHPLAIASGITSENVAEYMPFTDCFLVATGVSYTHTELDPHRIRRLVQIISS